MHPKIDWQLWGMIICQTSYFWIPHFSSECWVLMQVTKLFDLSLASFCITQESFHDDSATNWCTIIFCLIQTPRYCHLSVKWCRQIGFSNVTARSAIPSDPKTGFGAIGWKILHSNIDWPANDKWLSSVAVACIATKWRFCWLKFALLFAFLSAALKYKTAVW